MQAERAVEQFLLTLKNESTKVNYRIALREFVRPLRTLSQITTEHIENFKKELQDKSPTTIAARLSAVKSFCEFCWSNGWLPEDPSLRIHHESVPRYTNSKNIKFEELKKLLESIELNNANGIRDFLLIRLIFSFGDVEKILNLKWEEQFPERFNNAIKQYKLYMTTEFPDKKLERGYLFFNLETGDNKKPLSISGLRRILSTRTLRAGFPDKHFDFEALKRLRAKQIYEQTKSVEAVRQFCGHRSIKATREFLRTLNLEI